MAIAFADPLDAEAQEEAAEILESPEVLEAQAEIDEWLEDNCT